MKTTRKVYEEYLNILKGDKINMKTISKELTVQEAITLAKPFVLNLKKKGSRPILQTALITKDHVFATDSHTLIKLNIENSGDNKLHHYTKDTENLDASSYPNVERIIPDPYGAQVSFIINVAEWIEAHEGALVAAKENDKYLKNGNMVTKLKEGKIMVDKVTEYKVNVKADKKKKIKASTKMVPIPLEEQIGFTYTLDAPTPVENVAYNAKYMLQVLKAAKKLKQTEITLHYYSSMRPMLFTAGPMTALVLPIRLV